MAEFTILIADDDEDDFLILQNAFDETKKSINLDRAKNGMEAMDYLYHKIKYNQKLPDVIILDINMPKMDGITVLELMRSTELFFSVPVIMYSTSETDAERCLILGANGCATKGDSFTKVAAFATDVLAYLKNLTNNPACVFRHRNAFIDK